MYSFFFQAEDGIRDYKVTGVQTCALPIYDRIALDDFRTGRTSHVNRRAQQQHGEAAPAMRLRNQQTGHRPDDAVVNWTQNARSREVPVLRAWRDRAPAHGLIPDVGKHARWRTRLHTLAERCPVTGAPSRVEIGA